MKKTNLLEHFINSLIEIVLSEQGGAMAQTAPVARPRAQAATPTQQFNLEQFKAARGIPLKMRYLQSTLKQIGEGGSRNVFQFIDNKSVIKMAKDAAGVGQNQAESTLCKIEPQMDIFAKVYEVGDGHEWIRSEFAPPTSEGVFQQKTGIAWNAFTAAVYAFFASTKGNKPATPEQQQSLAQLTKNQWFKKLLNIIEGCDYEPGDLTKIDSWGLTQDGRLVIIDSGFTSAVQKAHYAKQ